jgi:N-acetylglucosaminyl-diphospho-decaprenol L-rhamnosyltransferase
MTATGAGETERPPILSVVIVTHNSADDLPECICSLSEHRGDVDVRVVVADSGSTDDTAFVAARFPVTFLPGENRGFAAANNRALRHEEVSSSRYVLFLNPDTVVRAGTLGELVELCDARPAAGIFVVRQVDEGGNLIHSLARFPTPLRYWSEAFSLLRRRFGIHVWEDEPYARESECDWAFGAFLLVRAEVLGSVGWFDERFFLTSEEVDLCRRAREAGWKVVYLPSFTIMHRFAHRLSNPWRSWILVHHQVVYARKWFSRPGRLLTRIALAIRHGSHSLSRQRSPDDRRARRFATRAALGLSGPAETGHR